MGFNNIQFLGLPVANIPIVTPNLMNVHGRIITTFSSFQPEENRLWETAKRIIILFSAIVVYPLVGVLVFAGCVGSLFPTPIDRKVSKLLKIKPKEETGGMTVSGRVQCKIDNDRIEFLREIYPKTSASNKHFVAYVDLLAKKHRLEKSEGYDYSIDERLNYHALMLLDCNNPFLNSLTDQQIENIFAGKTTIRKIVNIGRFLGSGTHSSVYEATLNGKKYAVKVRDVERDFVYSKRLNHVNIARVYGIFNDHLFMELVEGTTMNDFYSRCTPQMLLKHAAEVASASAHMHTKGCHQTELHNQNNIMVTHPTDENPGGVTKIIDHGTLNPLGTNHIYYQAIAETVVGRLSRCKNDPLIRPWIERLSGTKSASELKGHLEDLCKATSVTFC